MTGNIDPKYFQVGDPVSESPVGLGYITDFTERGYPRVNHVAVTWLRRTDGAVFDPHCHVGGNKGPVAKIIDCC